MNLELRQRQFAGTRSACPSISDMMSRRRERRNGPGADIPRCPLRTNLQRGYPLIPIFATSERDASARPSKITAPCRRAMSRALANANRASSLLPRPSVSQTFAAQAIDFQQERSRCRIRQFRRVRGRRHRIVWRREAHGVSAKPRSPPDSFLTLPIRAEGNNWRLQRQYESARRNLSAWHQIAAVSLEPFGRYQWSLA